MIMTEKQKKAVKILNSLWNANGGMMRINEEEYFILLDCVLDREEPKVYSPTTPLRVNIPHERTASLQCYEKDGVCTNPFKDCINCLKVWGECKTNTVTSTNIK